MRRLTSWGRLDYPPQSVVHLGGMQYVPGQMAASEKPGVAHGMGRSYGDVCLNPGGTVWNTSACDAFIAFDEWSGRLVVEAGVLLRDIQRLLVPRGWMLPVTPGTQMVTVGGAIANDVHGKNHHRRGSFGHHVHHIRLLRSDGQVIDCGLDSHPDWFAATIGGLGLTGLILQAEIQLMKVAGPWMATEMLTFDSLERFFQLADESAAEWEYTVAWVDCVARRGSRGLFIRGNHSDDTRSAHRASRALSMPFAPPFSLVNRLSLRPLNLAYYTLGKWRAGPGSAHYEKFFYPLDGIGHWNRMYGPRGFYQYQCLLPRERGLEVVSGILAEIASAGDGSFLAVLKTFGSRVPAGLLSFAQEGVTLALDFPNRGARTLALFDRLDALVLGDGGRLYPAKDARMPRAMFEAGYPGLRDFLKFRDPGISSGLSRRLMDS